MDRLKQMEAFISAVDCGSLAKAARDAGVTPAMLGRRVDALERRLGVKLLHRSTRHLDLTEEGALFIDHCRKLVSGVESAEELVRAGRDTAVGQLRVTAPAGFGRRHVAPLGPAFAEAFPQVQLSFDLTDRVVDLVREGCDLGIRIGKVLDPNLVAIPLARNRRVVCASPKYLEAHGTPRSLSDLAHHNCLAFSPLGGQQSGWTFRDGEKLVTIRTHGRLECNDGELLHRWACEGLGLAWRSTWEIQGQLARHELVTVLDEYALPEYDVRAVYPQQRHVPARVRMFIEFLRSAYAAPGYWTS